MTRPPQITERHLQRRAVVYVRQSSMPQVREHIGSTAIQRSMVDSLRAWGWPDNRVEVIDLDLGVSGSHPGARQGFNRLVEDMEAGQVGLVSATDFSRLSRNSMDLIRLLYVAQGHDVLIAINNQIRDLRDPNEEFLTAILGLNAVRDVRAFASHTARARRQKAELGVATTPAPMGYVRAQRGVWVKHPDPRVREVIELIFDKFWELGSARSVVRYLRQQRIDIPRQPRAGRPPWVEATYDAILGFLHHPAYAGHYVFGRTVQACEATHGQYRRKGRPVPPEQQVFISNHHEPYVPPERWSEIQDRLRANRPTLAGPLGRGAALVQGRLWCAIHHRILYTTYSRRERLGDGTVRRRASYHCTVEERSGDRRYHGSIDARIVDALVEAELLAALAPPSLDALREAARDVLSQHEALVRGRQDEIRRAEHAVAEAERAYAQAASIHSRLRERLADRAEEALRRLEELRTDHRRHPLTPPITLDPTEVMELQEQGTDLPVWWSQRSFAERKSLLRMVIRAIYVTPGPEAWPLEIEWENRSRTRHVLTTWRAVRAVPADVCADILARYQAGVALPEIASELNARGVSHRLGRWTTLRVASALHNTAGRMPGGKPAPRLGVADRVVELHAQGLLPAEIAKRLREEGVLTRRRRPLTIEMVCTLLRQRNLPVYGPTRPPLADLLREWSARVSREDIAQRLNERGFRTVRGELWTARRVRYALVALRRWART